MNFEPQCTEQWQLYEHMARVIRMCKEAGFNRPCECVKFEGKIGSANYGMLPSLAYNPNSYEFALAIFEGHPVFRGDVLYSLIDGTEVIIDCFVNWNHPFSWNPPQRTIEINGVKVKAPTSIEHSDDAEDHRRYGLFITFADMHDAEAFKAALEGK